MATRYLSSRGGSYDCSFESVVIQGLADDGGLFLPEEIPQIPSAWSDDWLSWNYEKLAFEIFSLYISPSEVPRKDLEAIVKKTYSPAVFRASEVTPIVALDEEQQLYLLELFHGPTLAFKDVALQFLGNLLEFFLIRRNDGKNEQQHEHLTIIAATSGDTGSAAIYGLRGKSDVSIVILYPHQRISPIQEAQMTSVLSPNVHNFAVRGGTFDDCQDLVKALFSDEDIKRTHQLGGANSINWARILAQITYYFAAYSSLRRSGRIKAGAKVRYVVPSGNFGNVLAGYFAKRMGLPVEKLVVATNENDILKRFWDSGYYEKKPVHSNHANGHFQEDVVNGDESSVKETYSPAMDILHSSNFERLLWFLAYQVYGQGPVSERKRTAGDRVKGWLGELKMNGGFGVEPSILEAAKEDFESERVSDEQTLRTIGSIYSATTPAATSDASPGTLGTSSQGKYILDPHTSIGVHAAHRSLKRATGIPHVALATAHPAKFSKAVEEALKIEKDFEFKNILPEQFQGLEALERKVTLFNKSDGLEGLRTEIRSRVPASR